MSDRMAVMQGGKILQVGRADEIYRAPASRFVANFVGPINEVPLTAIETVGGRRRGRASDALSVWLPNGEPSPANAPQSLILRPEVLQVGTGELGTDNRLSGDVQDVIYLGASSECRLRVAGLRLFAILPSAAAARLRPGERVSVGWNAEDGVLVDAG
jgi:putative spermidine/putrescine transport system ATP-binding protein